MTPLSKVWAKWLLIGQYANVVLMLLLAFGAASVGPSVPWLETWKANALQLHASIVAVLASLQGIAKALPDRDKDGTPDMFDDSPDGDAAGGG